MKDNTVPIFAELVLERGFRVVMSASSFWMDVMDYDYWYYQNQFLNLLLPSQDDGHHLLIVCAHDARNQHLFSRMGRL
jgi:hypothetical protein